MKFLKKNITYNMRISENNIQELKAGQVFVFGSNLNGYHSGGAARLAHDKFGAIWGVGNGKQGNSYAIPTIGKDGRTLSVKHIEAFVAEFIYFAETHHDLIFLVTEIGCGIAGHKIDDIAPLFFHAVDMKNIYLPARFIEAINALQQHQEG